MRREIKILVLIAAIIIIAAILGSSYYRGTVQNNDRGPSNAANSALVRSDSATLGKADAKVTLVEFLDPECESCAIFSKTVKKVVNDYGDSVRLVVRYVPLHPNSMPAANFIEAAGEQGKYWEALDLLFAKQDEWGEKHGAPASAPKPDIKALFAKYAGELGLEVEKVNAAVKEEKYAAKIERDQRDAQTMAVRQTPTLFVNGRRLARLYETDLKALIDEELKR